MNCVWWRYGLSVLSLFVGSVHAMQPRDLYPAHQPEFYQRCAVQFVQELCAPGSNEQRDHLVTYVRNALVFFEPGVASLQTWVEQGVEPMIEPAAYGPCEKMLDHEAIGWRHGQERLEQDYKARLEHSFARYAQCVRMFAEIKNCVPPEQYRMLADNETPLTCLVPSHFYEARECYVKGLPLTVEHWILLTEACLLSRAILQVLASPDSAQ